MAKQGLKLLYLKKSFQTVIPDLLGTELCKGNTKEGKALKAVGFKKSYSGGYTLSNPGETFVQNMNIKEAVCEKYVEIFGKLTGIKLYVSSRMD